MAQKNSASPMTLTTECPSSIGTPRFSPPSMSAEEAERQRVERLNAAAHRSKFAIETKNMRVQSDESFRADVERLSSQQRLVVHTLVLPHGVRPDDPRLAHGRVVSATTYTADSFTLGTGVSQSFTAHVDASLSRDTHRLVVRDS